MRLRVAERKAEMASTSPGPDTQATHVMGEDDSAENYLNGMIGDTEDKARWHAREALKYARMSSPRTGVPNRNPHSKMQAESFAEVMAAQDDLIGRTQASLAVTRIVDQIRDEFLEGFLKDERENAVARAVVSGLVSYVPLVPLKSSRGEGRPSMSDPKVWSAGAIAVVTLADAFRGKFARLFKDLEERRERAVDGAKEGNAKPAEMDDSARRLLEEVKETVDGLNEKIRAAAAPAENPPP
jgi:hypothetical protein